MTSIISRAYDSSDNLNVNHLYPLMYIQSPLRLIIHSTHGFQLLNTNEITKIEADGSYSSIHTLDGKQKLTSESIGIIQKKLPPQLFFRCHQSCLVNLASIIAYDKSESDCLRLINGSSANLAVRRRKDLLFALEDLYKVRK